MSTSPFELPRINVCALHIQVLLVLQDNSLELHTLTDSQLTLKHSITSPGHRSDVRWAVITVVH